MLYCKNSFVHSIGFFMGGRFFAFFCFGWCLLVYSLYSLGLSVSFGSVFLLVIYLSCL